MNEANNVQSGNLNQNSSQRRCSLLVSGTGWFLLALLWRSQVVITNVVGCLMINVPWTEQHFFSREQVNQNSTLQPEYCLNYWKIIVLDHARSMLLWFVHITLKLVVIKKNSQRQKLKWGRNEQNRHSWFSCTCWQHHNNYCSFSFRVEEKVPETNSLITDRFKQFKLVIVKLLLFWSFDK